MGGRKEGRKNGYIDEWMNGCMDVWMHGCMQVYLCVVVGKPICWGSCKCVSVPSVSQSTVNLCMFVSLIG